MFIDPHFVVCCTYAVLQLISYLLNQYIQPLFPIPQVLEKERKRSRNGEQDAASEDEEEEEDEAQDTPRTQRKRSSVIL